MEMDSFRNALYSGPWHLDGWKLWKRFYKIFSFHNNNII